MTNPTTISAITDIPAKTPKPIGRTESFLPGRVNAACEVELAAAALAEEAAAAEDEAESAAEVAEAADEDAPEDALAELVALLELAPDDAEDVAEAEVDPVADAEPESVGVALVLTVDKPCQVPDKLASLFNRMETKIHSR